MAAFYDAKADVFVICKDGDVHVMEKLSHMLTPSGVDFHETADTIMEHAVDLAKKATAS